MSKEETEHWRKQRVKNIETIASTYGKHRMDVCEVYDSYSQMGRAYYLFRPHFYSEQVQKYAYALTEAYFSKNKMLGLFANTDQLMIEKHSDSLPKDKHYGE